MHIGIRARPHGATEIPGQAPRTGADLETAQRHYEMATTTKRTESIPRFDVRMPRSTVRRVFRALLGKRARYSGPATSVFAVRLPQPRRRLEAHDVMAAYRFGAAVGANSILALDFSAAERWNAPGHLADSGEVLLEDWSAVGNDLKTTMDRATARLDTAQCKRLEGLREAARRTPEVVVD
jgi:hypothetical protein